jgi:1,4-dihydroxy-2-naphthoate polyprenyltransferase
MINSRIKMQTQSQLKIWLQAVRTFSFTASMLPVLVGAALAMHYTGPTSWLLLPVILIASILLQAATNTVSDYYDYKNGVDRDYTYGSSRVITDGLLPARALLKAGIIIFAVATALGIILIVARGLPVVILGVVALAGGFFYTAKPIGYKYFAVGDLLVFILMGPLMVMGTNFVLTGRFSTAAIFVSLPIGFLVAAILHANNTRDIKHDIQAKVKTVANILGYKAAKVDYYILLTAAYISVVVMIIVGILGFWTLLVFLSLPVAIKNIRQLHEAGPEDIEAIAQLDVHTAQLHLLFGGLLTIGIVIGALLQ